MQVRDLVPIAESIQEQIDDALGVMMGKRRQLKQTKMLTLMWRGRAVLSQGNVPEAITEEKLEII
jgi:hypothetical protein